MKRFVPLIVVAVAALLFWFRAQWLPAAADHLAYLGYVEGETRLVGPIAGGRIVSVAVVKGGTVAKGAPLFQLDDAAQRAEVARLRAAVGTAQATLANLETGKRAEEMALIDRQKAEAMANVDLAMEEFERAKSLKTSGITAETRYDQARAALAVAQERLHQVEASEVIARLPARPAELDAARSRVAEAEAALATATARLADYQAVASEAAIVDDVFFDPGEVVGAGQPIVSLLSPDAATLRFYVPEAELTKASAGVTVRYSCDGCGDGGTATITHVAATPEYTPPVIYSETARAKLVFLVEATPAAGQPALRPGLPIEVEKLP